MVKKQDNNKFVLETNKCGLGIDYYVCNTKIVNWYWFDSSFIFADEFAPLQVLSTYGHQGKQKPRLSKKMPEFNEIDEKRSWKSETQIWKS